MANRIYIAIDLKSFYASVECVKRGYDPLTTNLVVADKSRTEKTICLAVSPSLKAHGVSGRARLFEVIQRVGQVNAERRQKAPGHQFTAKSVFAPELDEHPEYELDYVVAVPQMAHYMEWSSRIYAIYLKYIAAEDIHVYSIDEVFMDVTDYLATYKMTAHELAMTMIHDVLDQTGITATAGIGTNLYLCKVAMDIVAKHIPADQDGVRIAELDEYQYREKLWDHRPLTDFWRVGRGYAKKLEALGLYTMGDVALYSTTEFGRDYLYTLFGINAELLIDHAWGYEPCTMEAIREYGAERKSLGSGQVLACPYNFEKARLVTREMADALSLDLADKCLVTDQIVLTIGYDRESLTNPEISKKYRGKTRMDYYGRKVPEHSHGTINLPRQTASTMMITEAAMQLYDRIVNPDLLVRRISITAGKVIPEDRAQGPAEYEQLDLFTDYAAIEAQRKKENTMLEKEKKRQKAILALQKKYGKNIVLKGMNLEEGATMRERNGQVGGHKA
ncbi:MAG: DNA methylase [Lachnospiraceae bacterium]|nr:DNA methylase [Lachnospiraceae bacterium]